MDNYDETITTGHDGEERIRPAFLSAKPVILPTPPRGCRKIGLRSKFSVRGHFVARVKGGTEICRIGFESKLEWDFAALALARNDVFDIVEQPFRTAFEDRLGKTRHHTFDYLVTSKCGQRTAVAVKVAQRVRNSNIIEDLKMIKAQLSPDHADEVALFTNEHFEPWQAWNAHHLLACRKTVDEDADDILLDVTKGLGGVMSIEHLVRMVGLGGRAYQAIVRAIFDGLLTLETKGRIGKNTLVSKGLTQ